MAIDIGEGSRRVAETGILGIAAALRGSARFGPRFERWHEIAPRPARTAPFPDGPRGVDRRIVDLFRACGIAELYEHQARAIREALAGKDVLVATPTASGKTLCYTVPVLQALL